MNRLMERYQNEVVKSLMEKFNYSSKMQAPKIEKIVLNIGVGDAVSNSKLLDEAVKYTEKKEENKIILNSETIYYYDEEIIPTLLTDYIRSLEDNQFQCND